MEDYMRRARAELKRVFGYAEFRPGQERAISRIMSNGDMLAILPTGGGKSICYQIPALIGEGLTLVISPLISLMKDQVDQLAQLGVPAGALNSTIDAQRSARLMDMARANQLKLIYIAPERLEYESSRFALLGCDVRRVIIDEAHCVSQWGHDFRPSYLGIADFIDAFERRPTVAAFTATATERVCHDIETLLRLHNPEIIKTGYDRPNLEFSVVRLQKSLREEYIKRFIDGHPGQSGIVYCASRRDAEGLAGALGAACYHAGMGDEDRRSAQDEFINDNKYVICATNAFGMGIDKPNVRFVIHYHMPASIEAYWQEAGRAGRDGMAAECVLLCDSNDYNFWTHMILRDEGDEDEKNKRRQRLKYMIDYTHQSGCLRKYLVGYFGEQIPDCGVCSNCCAEGRYIDITREAQMVLSAVKRCGERVGKALVARVLNGSRDKRILELGLDRQSTYGLMRKVERKQITEYIDELITQDYLRLTEGQYPVLMLTERSASVLRGQESVQMRVQTGDEYSREVLTDISSDGRERRKANADKRRRDTPYGDPLFERLRTLRKRIAGELGVPAFMVFGDATLADMARKRPTTRAQMLNVTGVGEQKLARFGEQFISEVKRCIEEGGCSTESGGKSGLSPLESGAGEAATLFGYADYARTESAGRAQTAAGARDSGDLFSLYDPPASNSGKAPYRDMSSDAWPAVSVNRMPPAASPGFRSASKEANISNDAMRRMTSDLMLFLRAHASEFLSDFPNYTDEDVDALCGYMRKLSAEYERQ